VRSRLQANAALALHLQTHAELRNIFERVAGFAPDGYARDLGHNEPLGAQNFYRRVDSDAERLRCLFPDPNHPIHLALADYKSAAEAAFQHTDPKDDTFFQRQYSDKLCEKRLAFMKLALRELNSF
jgi:hypothetical protein